jgi:hypothetical protein
MGKKIMVLMTVLFGGQSFLLAQGFVDSIKQTDIAKIINVLAADSMMGRGNGSPELLKAGLFIGEKFKQAGLYPLAVTNNYYLPFRPFGGSNKIITDELTWNEEKLLPAQFMYVHPAPGNYAARSLADFSVVRIKTAFTNDMLEKYGNGETDVLIWTSKKQSDKENYFPPMLTAPAGGMKHNVLLVVADHAPSSILLSGNDKYYSSLEYNVAGILPGKTKPEEIIIFSAHYDHEGVYPSEKKDSIMNGANDDASGVTALLSLAHYFSLRNDNERTIMFCAFAGEEIGLTGSKDFLRYIDPLKITAVINIEMIGVPEYGKGIAFITGEKYSTLPAILMKELKKAKIKIRAEPNASKLLFNRSDNFSFAAKGIPAHTIMSSDDDDPCYHKPCDEVKRISLPHLTQVIKAIALASESLVNGKETPTRIKIEELK